MVEILAPCGRAEAAETLLAAGADGLYVGLSSLSHGRRGAELSLDEIEAVCRTTHEVGGWVLLSLNLMPLVAEEPRWVALGSEAAAVGVDGVILQDPGLARALRLGHPRLAIHVSVGAMALNAADARFWREAGADALVLQPGTAPEQAASIRRQGGLEVELFVSGRTCQATLLGRCGMGNYLRQAWKRTELREAVPEGSRKRSGVCYYVCEGEWQTAQGPLGPWGPVPIELGAPLASYLEAGVRYLKLGGRDRPTGEVVEEIQAVRRAVAGKEKAEAHAISGHTCG
jgi:putative protease